MICTKQTGFLVQVTDGTQIAANDLKVCVLSDVVFRHFKHAKMEVSDRAEGTTSHKDDRGLLWIMNDSCKAMMGERIVGRVGEIIGRARWGVHEMWGRVKDVVGPSKR